MLQEENYVQTKYFYKLANFPGVIGAIDEISNPIIAKSETIYWSIKKPPLFKYI